MTKSIKNSLTTIVSALLFIAGIHILLLSYVLPESYTDISLFYIYIFLLVVSVLGILGVLMVQKHNKEIMPQALLAYTVIKFLASLVFLLPDLLNQTDFTKPFVYQFFGIFFPLLLVESLVFMRILNNPSPEN
jgi:predicted membrane channel-forming protein YqfA (hemolysin III family)